MDAIARKPYPTDLTDEQWELMQIVIPDARPGGRPRSVSLREVASALLYLNRSGCRGGHAAPRPTTQEYGV